jgi:hypothetical protein
MSKTLVTQSLLASWNYIYKAYDQDEAYDSFLRTIHREKLEQSEAMLNGIEFEALVYSGKIPEDHKWYKGASKAASMIAGAQTQVKAYKTVEIGGRAFLLYGIMDALRAGSIKDIKFSKSYEVGKFRDSPQHPMYLELVPEALDFEYIVSDGQEVYTEKYLRPEVVPVEKIITGFLDYLEAADLSPVFFEKWTAM